MNALVPPQAIEAEQAVLGSILLRPAVFDEVADLLSPEDFYRGAHGVIFRTMIDLWLKKEPIDLVTVTGLLKTRGKLDEVGGAVFLAELSEQVGTAANAPAYAQKVKDCSRLRSLLDVCQTISHECLGPVDDVDAFIDKSESAMFRLLDRPKANTVKLQQIITTEIERAQERYHSKGALTGIPSGLIDLDATTGGFQPGDLVLLAARPSMGKTALATNFAMNAGVPVAFFSLEMSAPQLAQRIICSEGHIGSINLRTGQLLEEEWTRLIELAPLLDKPIYINDSSTFTPLELRAQARRLAMRHQINMVVVDYLQLMNSKARSREQEVSEISRSLKALAKELHVPVIALSQLNRDVEKRPNKRPILPDLRDSGSLEQDADVILFIYRESVYKEGAEEGVAELHVAKQRNGPLRRIQMAYLSQFFRFENFAKTN